jgi:hypothetical protein
MQTISHCNPHTWDGQDLIQSYDEVHFLAHGWPVMSALQGTTLIDITHDSPIARLFHHE